MSQGCLKRESVKPSEFLVPVGTRCKFFVCWSFEGSRSLVAGPLKFRIQGCCVRSPDCTGLTSEIPSREFSQVPFRWRQQRRARPAGEPGHLRLLQLCMPRTKPRNLSLAQGSDMVAVRLAPIHPANTPSVLYYINRGEFIFRLPEVFHSVHGQSSSSDLGAECAAEEILSILQGSLQTPKDLGPLAGKQVARQVN